jgi:hypothetical protein
MKTLKNLLLVVCLLIAGVLLTSYIIWHFYEKKRLNLYVLDNTVKDFSYSNHKSLFWVLNNSRVTNVAGHNYNCNTDYYGFFPAKPLSSTEYKIKRIRL